MESPSQPNDQNVPEGEQASAAPDGFAPQWIGEHDPNNNNGWIEWDVPLGGELDEPIVNPEVNEEVMDDDDWDDEVEWLMAPVTPPRATMTVSSTYEIGGPSTAVVKRPSSPLPSPRLSVPPTVIENLSTRLGNLEYRHGVLVRNMEDVSDAEVADSIAIGEIHPKVATVGKQVQVMGSQTGQIVSRLKEIETRVQQVESRVDTHLSGQMAVQGQDVIAGSSQQVQTLQTALHETELQNQQLRTRVTEMESRGYFDVVHAVDGGSPYCFGEEASRTASRTPVKGAMLVVVFKSGNRYADASRPSIVGRWRYLIPADSQIHNYMLIPDYQDIIFQDFRYFDEFECYQVIKIGSQLRLLFQLLLLPPTSPKSASSGKRRNRKACFVCKSVDHLIKDCDFHAKKMAQPTLRNYAHRGNHKQYAPLTHIIPQKHMVPTAVLTQSKLVFNTVVRPVSAIMPKINVTRPRYAYPVVTKSKSPIRRHITRSPSIKTSNSPPRVTAAQAPVVSTAQGMQGKWGNPQHALKDKGVIDSRCSRHMIGNMSYLSDFEELNSGYVAFGGNPKGGKISGKGKIKTGKLDFDDVYFVKELKFNLFSVSQICDKKNSVLFTDTECLILSPDFKLPDESQVLLRVSRENNMYNVNLKHIVPSRDLTCLFAKAPIDESNLWHRRLGHINFKTINKLVKGKQHRASYKTKPVSSVDQPLFRLHMDLFGPTSVKSLNKKSYCLVITDDYSRFTWVFFLATKDETSPILKTFITGLENQFSLKQNGITERKNRTLIEAARTMLADSLLAVLFWAEAVNTACYVQNKVLVTKPHNKTSYELLHGRTASIGFMRPFGYHVTILNTLDPLGKFEGNVDEGFLVGYSVSSKAFRVFNSRTRIVQETLHVNSMENKPNVVEKVEEEIDQQYMLFPVWSSGSTNPQNNDEDAAFDGKEHDAKKPESEVNVSPNSSTQSRKQDDMTKEEDKGKSLVKSFTGYKDLNAEFEDCFDNNSNKVNAAGSIVPIVGQNSPNSTNTFSVAGPSNDITYFDDEDVVGAEADFNNLETSITEEGIDYEEVFAPVARIKVIRLFLAYASFMGFKVYQMDVKSAFLYGTIEEEVYVCQPPGFEDPDHPDKVYKVVKALYGLHQALRAWYETLANYLLKNGFQRGKIDQTLFIKKQKGDILLMSSMGEITFFLGLQVKQKKDGIFISQDKYVAEILKKFGLTKGKSASTPIDTKKPLLKDHDGEDVYGKPHLGLWYPKDSPFDLVAYSDSDYASASLDKKSTTEGCQFLGCRLISWKCKKQTVVATLSTKAEYVAAASCCA
nr:hypothetical protein [Tanacetum cinerariifolium]